MCGSPLTLFLKSIIGSKSMDSNQQFLIADFTVGDSRKLVYLLKPGDLFERFGGSRHGLLVRKTPSLIVSEIQQGCRNDSEFPQNDRGAWDRIFRAAHRAKYNPEITAAAPVKQS